LGSAAGLGSEFVCVVVVVVVCDCVTVCDWVEYVEVVCDAPPVLPGAG
jgi:hypothetical protein